MTLPKRQVPSLIDVASSADRLQRLTITDYRGQPVSSALARARQASVDAADAKREEDHQAKVNHKYVDIGSRKMERIITLPPDDANQALAAQNTASLGRKRRN